MPENDLKLLSSKQTYFYKRVFPALWFGFLGAMLLFAGVASLVGPPFFKTTGSPLGLLVVPVLASFGYLMMRKLLFGLVDEVWDGGDHLVVRRRRRGWGSRDWDEERIALSDISNISASTMINPPRVTLSLRDETRLGREVTFLTPRSRNPFRAFGKSPIVEELIRRVDEARSARR